MVNEKSKWSLSITITQIPNLKLASYALTGSTTMSAWCKTLYALQISSSSKLTSTDSISNTKICPYEDKFCLCSLVPMIVFNFFLLFFALVINNWFLSNHHLLGIMITPAWRSRFIWQSWLLDQTRRLLNLKMWHRLSWLLRIRQIT
jgi:hypothetical protein